MNTDKAREALIAELMDIHHCGLRDRDIEPTADRILAALRTPEAPEAVAIKPLEWREGPRTAYKGSFLTHWEADGFGGRYVITFNEKDPDAPQKYQFAGEYKPYYDIQHTGSVYLNAGRIGTLAEAKAAAQADYERRIRSALTTPPDPTPTDTDKPFVTEARAEAAAREIWNDIHARYGGAWDDLPDDLVVKVQTIATAKASLAAALAAKP